MSIIVRGSPKWSALYRPVLVIVFANLTGCAFDTTLAKSTDLAETKAGLEDVKSKVARLQAAQATNSLEDVKAETVKATKGLEVVKAEMERLQAVFTELTAQVFHLEETTEKLNGAQKIVLLRPGSQSYSQIQLDLGSLIVYIANVKPYANGSKVVIKFGNPLSASITGLSGTVEWGKIDEGGHPLSNQSNTKEIQFSGTIKPASWTSTSIILEDAPPTDLGFVRLKNLTHKGITLLVK